MIAICWLLVSIQFLRLVATLKRLCTYISIKIINHNSICAKDRKNGPFKTHCPFMPKGDLRDYCGAISPLEALLIWSKKFDLLHSGINHRLLKNRTYTHTITYHKRYIHLYLYIYMCLLISNFWSRIYLSRDDIKQLVLSHILTISIFYILLKNKNKNKGTRENFIWTRWPY